MSISKEDVMDRMVRKIVGEEDADYISQNFLGVKITKYQKIVGCFASYATQMTVQFASRRNKYSVNFYNTLGEVNVSIDMLIDCHDEMADALRRLKLMATNHKNHFKRVQERRNENEKRQQAELEKLYKQYS